VTRSLLGWTRAWHDELASAVLIVSGMLLAAAGLWLDRAQGESITLLILGAGLVAVGAFLPRVQGRLTIGASGIGIPVGAPHPLAETLLRFEHVRETTEKALQADPDPEERQEKVAETVGRAFLDMFPTPTAVTASVAGSALAQSWTSSPEYSGGAALPWAPQAPTYYGGAALPENAVTEYWDFLTRLQEPTERFTDRIISSEAISSESGGRGDEPEEES
jgi:hypothetical protein